MKEQAVLFGTTTSLVGIITDPPEAPRGKVLPTILLLNAGRIHHVGPHRLYVTMARALAARGFVVLRFDFSGIGDSNVRTDALPFAKSARREVQEAMHYLHVARGSERFVLMGLCSGANISFSTACGDPRVVGVVLINPRGHLHGTDETLGTSLRKRALRRHYWRIAFASSFRGKNWVKAFTGQVNYPSLLKAMVGFGLGNPRTLWRNAFVGGQEAAAHLRMLTQWGVRLLHIYAEGDEGLDYLHVALGRKALGELHADARTRIEILPGANHTFTLLWSQQCLLDLVQRWVQAQWPAE